MLPKRKFSTKFLTAYITCLILRTGSATRYFTAIHTSNECHSFYEIPQITFFVICDYNSFFKSAIFLCDRMFLKN